MTALQHVALYSIAITERIRYTSEFSEAALFNIIHEEIPWLLLPDALRFYSIARQATHFEQTPDQTQISWIEFPNEETLQKLTIHNFHWNVKSSTTDYPQCAIGEESILEEFDIHNWKHPHYAALRCHLIQDWYLDSIIRKKMIDSSRRFKNDFIIKHNGRVIHGNELRANIDFFERLGFIMLTGLFFNRTGILMNRNWLETHVLESLLKAYPKELALNTYKYLDISTQMEKRINRKRFELSDDELSSLSITNQLECIYGELYPNVLRATRIEL